MAARLDREHSLSGKLRREARGRLDLRPHALAKRADRVAEKELNDARGVELVHKKELADLN